MKFGIYYYSAISHPFIIFFIFFLSIQPLSATKNCFSQLYYTSVLNRNISSSYIHEKNQVTPFDELLISWNAKRPKVGSYIISVSVRTNNHWSPFLPLAEWGKNHQRSFVNAKHSIVHAKHTRIELQKGRVANAFRIKIEAKGGADINNVHSICVATSKTSNYRLQIPTKPLKSVLIENIPKQSQFRLRHPRAGGICSPTATSSVLLHFHRNKHIALTDAQSLTKFTVNFAQKVLDGSYLNIYGNWILNTAQVYDASRGTALSYVQRLNNFEELHKLLCNKIPVVVSVRGVLPGGAKEYNNGHLLVVIGWDSKTKRVICVDSAFKTHEKTLVRYRLQDFLRAWGRSRNLSYVIVPTSWLAKLDNLNSIN